MFIAIEIPEAIRGLLSSIITELSRKRITSLRLMQLGGIHLTLKFLGNVESSNVEEIAQQMKKACAGIKPFRLIMSKGGVFPTWNNPRVLWIGLDGELKVLADFQQKLERGVEKVGFPAEERSFVPHLTLGRIKGRLTEAEKKALAEVLTKYDIQPPPGFTVNSINLMRSQLTPSGALYSLVQQVKFQALIPES